MHLLVRLSCRNFERTSAILSKAMTDSNKRP
jgi:hypothetical protein